MGRQRSPNRDKAFQIYKRHKGNIKNKDIAELLGEEPKTVSKWKTLDKWDKRIGISKESKKNSKKQDKEDSYVNVFEKEPDIEKQLVEIPETDEIRQKQLEFCVLYAKSFNATKSYQKVYQCSKTAAAVNGCKLLKNANVQKIINELKQNKLNQMMLKPEDIFQKYIDIAFADITDYISFGREKEIVKTKKTKNGTVHIYADVDYVHLTKGAGEVDGSIVREVKQGKYGVSVRLEDRQSALRWLSEHMDMGTAEQQARVESLRNKVRIENERLELEKKRFERDDF